MQRRDLLKIIGGTAGTAVLGASAVSNEESSSTPTRSDEPNSTNRDEEEEESIRREEIGRELVGAGAHDLLTNEELGELLAGLEAESDGRVSTAVLGESNEGREIHTARVGEGDLDVLAIAEQHGHEPFQAEGYVAALGYLGTADRSEVEELREEVTLHVIPRVNPDGFAARQRVNHAPDAPENEPEEGFHTREGGWDPNRYHRYDWEESTLYRHRPEEYPENPVPESRYVIELAREIDPEWVLDCHRQGPHVDSNGDLIDASIGWPQSPEVPADAQERSQQLATVLYGRLPEVEECYITEFTAAGEYPGIARNAHAIAGHGSVLFEMSTGTRGGIGYRIQLTAEAVLVAVTATADGSLYDADPARVEEIPAEWGTTVNL
ncbi:M14 family zinc carboxypeptidase [Halalkalicoccus sp. GCM10025322]|uniref:M14 family zinc carboxypeptidase n=2 Tax=Halococcaceae TaxID=1963270 RepID=UPI002F966C2E